MPDLVGWVRVRVRMLMVMVGIRANSPHSNSLSLSNTHTHKHTHTRSVWPLPITRIDLRDREAQFGEEICMGDGVVD